MDIHWSFHIHKVLILSSYLNRQIHHSLSFQISLEDFKAYVYNRGVVFDTLSNEEKRLWSETFDKSRQVQPTGK